MKAESKRRWCEIWNGDFVEDEEERIRSRKRTKRKQNRKAVLCVEVVLCFG